MGAARVHPSAVVADGAQLGDDVTVGAFTVIGSHARIGAGSSIGTHCVVGEGDHGPLEIGAGALIRSHTVIYAGSSFGPGLETGHHATIREQTHAGRNLRVGTQSDIQGHTTIGDFTRLHSNVFVAQYSTIGNFVWLFPHAVITNDPHPPSDVATVGATLEDYAVIGARATLLPGVRVARDALVAAGAVVTRDVAPERVVMGVPAVDRMSVHDVRWADGSDGSPYPWWTHFRRGYPADLVEFSEDGPKAP